MILGWLLLATVLVALLVGFLARMPLRQLTALCVAMLAAALAFYGLVRLLGPAG